MKRARYNWDRKTSQLYDQILKIVPVADVHVHIGEDEDGETATAEGILKKMKELDVSLAVLFPFNDPNNNGTFHDANEKVYDAVKKYPNRFVPFFRLDPKGKWKNEFNLRAKQGFVGVKLHPVRQKFKIDSKMAMEIYEKAEKNNMAVMIHAGLGMITVAKEVQKAARKFPKLKIILAHAAFVDMDNTIKAVNDLPNVYFDTSAIRVFDFYNLVNHVASDRILFGTDYPFYNYALAIELLVTTCLTYKKPINSIKRMMGLNTINLFKETELFKKSKIKNRRKLKEKIEKKHTYNPYKAAKRSMSKLKESIKVIAPPEDKKSTIMIIKYLKIYTLLNNAEVLLTKNTYKRAFNRLEIVKNLTQEQFSNEESGHVELINKNVKRIIKKRRKIIPILHEEESRDPNFAKTSIRIAKNLCLQRILRLT